MTEDKRPKKRFKRAIGVILFLLIIIFLARINKGFNDVLSNILLEPSGFFMERVSGPSRYIHDFLSDLSNFNRLRSENKRLRLEVAELRREINRYREESLENARLKSLLRMKNSIPGQYVVAHVVGYDLSAWRSYVMADRGMKDGVYPESVVLAGGGVAGRVLSSTLHYCKVMLLTDRNSRIPALVQRSRAMGILEGSGNGLCVLSYVEKGADVIEGDRVVTSGLGEHFPKGLLLGTIIKVEGHAPDEAMFQSIVVRPVADLKRLEELLIMLTQNGPSGKK